MERVATVEVGGAGNKHWIEDIAEESIKLQSELSGQSRRITRTQLENLDVTPSKQMDKDDILFSLWEIGRPKLSQQTIID